MYGVPRLAHRFYTGKSRLVNKKTKVSREKFSIREKGQTKLYVDIAPLPSGDGKVDVADLEVLMTYRGQKV